MECLVYGLWVRDFLKILFLHKFRLNSNDRFLAKAIFLLKISSKDLPMVCFVVTQHSESELSLCLRYSKTSSLQATKKIHGAHGVHGITEQAAPGWKPNGFLSPGRRPAETTKHFTIVL